jgi:F0F1-type ATP synthase assembly protein I
VQRLTPAVQLLGLGSYVATCIAGGTVGGYFLDRWLDTSPLLTLIGLGLGLVTAFYGGYRILMEALADSERWQRRQAARKPGGEGK